MVVDLGLPVLVGASRKRFLGELLAGDDGAPRPPDGREVASAAITALVAAAGAWGVRVHDVASSMDAVAVAAAMVVTYLGNSLVTWRGQGAGDKRREVGLFVVFNLIGLGISVLTLTISHDLLGLTSRLADNISANVVGLALGTLFRYWSYKTFVFTDAGPGALEPEESGDDDFVLLEEIRP